jgi:hypothetical protein
MVTTILRVTGLRLANGHASDDESCDEGSTATGDG